MEARLISLTTSGGRVTALPWTRALLTWDEDLTGRACWGGEVTSLPWLCSSSQGWPGGYWGKVCAGWELSQVFGPPSPQPPRSEVGERRGWVLTWTELRNYVEDQPRCWARRDRSSSYFLLSNSQTNSITINSLTSREDQTFIFTLSWSSPAGQRHRPCRPVGNRVGLTGDHVPQQLHHSAVRAVRQPSPNCRLISSTLLCNHLPKEIFCVSRILSFIREGGREASNLVNHSPIYRQFISYLSSTTENKSEQSFSTVNTSFLEYLNIWHFVTLTSQSQGPTEWNMKKRERKD